MSEPLLELNLDGIVGPTHNYAGLSPGNLASTTHRDGVSHPRSAALQGLAKMRLLMQLGVPQAVLPPQQRPALYLLRRLGFAGNDAEVVDQVGRLHPHLLAQCYSASSMWAANAATVAPTSDTADRRVHMTPANLYTHLHRRLESTATQQLLSGIFADADLFTVHRPLPGHPFFADEGAANHMRLQGSAGTRAVHIFVYGRHAFPSDDSSVNAMTPQRFPVRQTDSACAALARLHGLDAASTLYVQQHPGVVEQGVFHNDVIAMSHEDLLIFHQDAYVDATGFEGRLRLALGPSARIVVVQSSELSVAECVGSYLFNSQLVRAADGSRVLVAPLECNETPRVRQLIARWIEEDGIIDAVHFVDVRQSMHNGGGPACLRLRVPLRADELAAVHPHCLLDEDRYQQLCAWVQRHYREQLSPADLRDPQLIDEVRVALDELAQMLRLGSLYSFPQPGGADFGATDRLDP